VTAKGAEINEGLEFSLPSAHVGHVGPLGPHHAPLLPGAMLGFGKRPGWTPLGGDTS
jgi:hypothetical protein